MHADARRYVINLDKIDSFSLWAFIRLHDEHGMVGRLRRLNDYHLLLLQLLLLLIPLLCYFTYYPASWLCRRRHLSQGVRELDELLRQEPRPWVEAELVRKQTTKKVERPAERDFAGCFQHSCINHWSDSLYSTVYISWCISIFVYIDLSFYYFHAATAISLLTSTQHLQSAW